jgi:hypothetical protein
MQKIVRPENLNNQIYLLCLKKSRYVDEIAEIIYKPIYKKNWKSHKSTISTKCKELKNIGWLLIDRKANKKLKENLTKESRKSKKKVDGRSTSLRVYHKASITPITSKFGISKKDKIELKKIIESNEFKSLIKDEFTSIEDIIFYISSLTLTGEYSKNEKRGSRDQIKAVSKYLYSQQGSEKPFSEEEWENIMIISLMLLNNISDEGRNKIININPYVNILHKVAMPVKAEIKVRKKYLKNKNHIFSGKF